MGKLLVVALVGLAAQLVGGALGMGYGVTSTTLLLIVGLTPAAASASVHLAEVFTALARGVAHWRFGNVDWRLVTRMAVPGAVGAFAGATILSALPTRAAAPWMAGMLAVLGIYLLVRFARPVRPVTAGRPLRRRFLAPLGLVAGLVDATGGGGWGPIATPALLVSGRLEPRTVVGSVGTAEFLVAGAATAGFLLGLGGRGFALPMVGALLAGGLLAAPVAAWLVRLMPAQLLGAAVGGLIVLTNVRTLLLSADVATGTRLLGYAVVLAGWAVGLGLALRSRQQPVRLGADQIPGGRHVPAPGLRRTDGQPQHVPVGDPGVGQVRRPGRVDPCQQPLVDRVGPA